jgi:hypothetical protein
LHFRYLLRIVRVDILPPFGEILAKKSGSPSETGNRRSDEMHEVVQELL